MVLPAATLAIRVLRSVVVVAPNEDVPDALSVVVVRVNPGVVDGSEVAVVSEPEKLLAVVPTIVTRDDVIAVEKNE